MCRVVRLDVDATAGFGPETVSLDGFHAGQYRYRVNHYGARGQSAELLQSNAQVNTHSSVHIQQHAQTHTLARTQRCLYSHRSIMCTYTRTGTCVYSQVSIYTEFYNRHFRLGRDGFIDKDNWCVVCSCIACVCALVCACCTKTVSSPMCCLRHTMYIITSIAPCDSPVCARAGVHQVRVFNRRCHQRGQAVHT